MRKYLACLCVLLLPTLASAHAVLTSPTPRNSRDDIKDASGAPCGGTRSTNVHAFYIGDTLKVDWAETVNHDGHFELLFSMANDQGFSFLKDPNGKTLDNIAHSAAGGLPRPYSTTVKLPAQTCDACTLLLKQFMSSTNSYYYSCADVQLVQPGTDLAAGPIDMATSPPKDMGVAADASAADPASLPDDDSGTAGAGCSVAAGSHPAASLLWIVGAFSALIVRRRR